MKQANPRNGQVTLEYFIIASMLTGVTLIGFNSLQPVVISALQDLHKAAAKSFAGAR